MAQTFTSAATSINSGRLPAVYKRIPIRAGEILFDLGCGKYTNHIRAALPGIKYLPYDPYNQSEEVNNGSLAELVHAIRSGIPVNVVCSNVLNVIDDDATIWDTAGWLSEIIRATGCTGYVTVYEGDRSGTGRQTGIDQYQRNEPLRNYLRFFPGAVIKRGMIVIG